MRLELTATLVLEVLDEDSPAWEAREHRVPAVVEEILRERLKGCCVPLPTVSLTSVWAKEQVPPAVPLTVDRVQWQGDYAMSLLQQVRDAVVALRLTPEALEEHLSMIDKRRNK